MLIGELLILELYVSTALDVEEDNKDSDELDVSAPRDDVVELLTP